MTKLFLGGVPTGPDVITLIDALGDLMEGREIMHAEVEAILQIKRGSNRYRAVTEAWRRRELRESNIEIGALVSIGFRVLNANERVTTNINSFQSGSRKQGRSLRRLGAVRDSELDEIHRAHRDHAIRIGGAMLAQASALQKELSPPKAQPQLSQLKRQ